MAIWEKLNVTRTFRKCVVQMSNIKYTVQVHHASFSCIKVALLTHLNAQLLPILITPSGVLAGILTCLCTWLCIWWVKYKCAQQGWVDTRFLPLVQCSLMFQNVDWVLTCGLDMNQAKATQSRWVNVALDANWSKLRHVGSTSTQIIYHGNLSQ